jgi:predicted secreted protein
MISLLGLLLIPKEEQITTGKGFTFIITLKSNPTSGYAWVPSFDESFISLLSHKFRPNSSVVGSPGDVIFKFQAIRLGATRLKMSYKRNWEENPIDHVVYVVNII